MTTAVEFYAMATRGPRPLRRTSDDAHVSDEQVDEFVKRIQAERAKRGLPPTIQSPKVYLLLSAVIDAQREKAEGTVNAKPPGGRRKKTAPER